MGRWPSPSPGWTQLSMTLNSRHSFPRADIIGFGLPAQYFKRFLICDLSQGLPVESRLNFAISQPPKAGLQANTILDSSQQSSCLRLPVVQHLLICTVMVGDQEDLFPFTLFNLFFFHENGCFACMDVRERPSDALELELKL